MSTTTILWLQRDLRIGDHPALTWALQNSQKVVPLFIWSPKDEGDWPDGGASRWWLHHALESLKQDLASLGLHLVIRQGPYVATLLELCRQHQANSVVWSHRYEPAARVFQKEAIRQLTSQGITARHFSGSLLYEPWQISNKKGEPFQVFTPFWKHCLKETEQHFPLPVPKACPALGVADVSSLPLAELQLLPVIRWDKGLQAFWKPSCTQAAKQLEHFVRHALYDYREARDFPGKDGVSQLSPYLHWGQISPRQVWQATLGLTSGPGPDTFRSQLGWREFGHHLLYHFPHTPTEPLRPAFAAFPWVEDDNALHAWQRGTTGFPIIDAGMRQLWHIGWMHNRVRMIVGSFLVKNLLISWTEGARWFWDTLVDADLANNTLGWQWVGGCGADAAPYFRVFNPILQGEKFDSDGSYVRQWVPELADLPAKWIHKPWQAPEEVLRAAGIHLGTDYPRPIVDLETSRQRALDAFATLKESKP